MFKGLFKKHEDEDIFEVDPVVEQRRKEKFSSPLIYDEEFKENTDLESKQNTNQKIPEKTKSIEQKSNKSEKVKTVYQMTEVISPMNGLTKSTTEKKPVKPVKNKISRRRKSEDLVPVISPFYGDYEEKKPLETDTDITLQNTNENNSEVQLDKQPITVEENLRNIAKIIEEEQDQLKIIEERTGEFKLNLQSTDPEKKDSLIDEIDDNMSLDELMSLYEKKFKD